MLWPRPLPVQANMADTNLVRNDLEEFPLPLLRDDGAVNPLVQLPRQRLGQLSPQEVRDALPPVLDAVGLVQGHLDAPLLGVPRVQ